MAGGCSWTVKWLHFDNSYFHRIVDHATSDSGTRSTVSTGDSRSPSPVPIEAPGVDSSQLLWLPSDQALLDCPEYRPYFALYRDDQEAFFRDFAAAYLKLSTLGARFKYRIRVEACEER